MYIILYFLCTNLPISFSAVNCSEGMVYQQCGPACPKTCNDDDNVDCPSGCVDGCFCPTGMVLSNGQCINESDCEGTAKLILIFL